MCWKCDNPNADPQVYLNELREDIAQYGFAIQFVGDDRRPFAYTIGLHEIGLHELLVTGLSADASSRVLYTVGCQMMAEGLRLVPSAHINLAGEFHLEVVEVEHPDVHLKFAVDLCGTSIRAYQLVWADARGRWPWDPRWTHGRRLQAVLGARKLLG